jgi:DNA polymerase-1
MIAVLVSMERNGVELDANALGKQQLDVIAQMETIKTQAFELAGNAFRILAPCSLRIGIFCRFGLLDDRRPVAVTA